ncbi:MAG TPA: chemotaxis response regulator protein-glutamate methylesterase [Myxococcales bacterium]|nr:chemotaxis response regulator protein-glutamate methylesterase [Myxococcales bacterium]
MTKAASRPLDVLVIDDSAVVRQSMAAVLARRAGTSVSAASDALIGLRKIRERRPDVIVLDLELPKMDGLTFLRKLMAEDPIPVVVCSTLAGPGTEAAIRALEEGAVEVIHKPTLGARQFIEESVTQVIDAVEAAFASRLVRRSPRPAPPAFTKLPLLRNTTGRVIAIGASTGGTEAIREILESMPPDAPGTVLVQHMPEQFTAAFAARLDQLCRIEVREARQGDRVTEGLALIAPGNHHLRLLRSGAHYLVEVTSDPPVSRHRPSVDVLFQSVAAAAGPNAVGALLTGMGDDGADGLLSMLRAGASTFAQDEASCVVFGMPREAILRGAAQHVVPLSRMAEALRGAASRLRGRHSPV